MINEDIVEEYIRLWLEMDRLWESSSGPPTGDKADQLRNKLDCLWSQMDYIQKKESLAFCESE